MFIVLKCCYASGLIKYTNVLLFWLYSAPSLVLQKTDCALAYLQHNGLLVVQIIADGWLLPLGGRSATAPVSCLQHFAVAVRYLVYFL